MLLTELLSGMKDSQYLKTKDAGFKESDHPRDESGQFAESSSGSSQGIDLSKGHKSPGVQSALRAIFPQEAGELKITTTAVKGGFHFSAKGKTLDFTAAVEPGKGVHLGGIHIKPSQEGKGIGKTIIKNMVDFVRRSNTKEITLLADLKVGRYAWAKLGFDYESPDDLNFAKRWLGEYCKSYGIPFTEKEKSKIKCAKDVAEFRVEGKKLKGMDIGKAFMLDHRTKGHGPWMGVLKV